MKTETKHTQGPWKVLEHARGRGRTCVTTSNGAPVQAVICEIDTKSVATDDATRLSNARLIAAAPELLHALKCLVRETSFLIHGDGTNGAIVANEIRNAIATIGKGEGF